MRYGVALLAALSVGGCGTREGVSNAAGQYDEGQECLNTGGHCYTGFVRSLCVVPGPAGCDEDPSAPGAVFCCIQFSDASVYANQSTASGGDD